MSHVVGGAVITVMGILGIVTWWDNFSDFLRGSIPFALLLGGLIAISTGIQIIQQKKVKPSKSKA